INRQQIALRFIDAEQFINEMLPQLVLTDTSTYYEILKENLSVLERKYGVKAIEDEEILREFEHHYLLLSLTGVSKCEKYFQKLIEMYFDQDFSLELCNEYNSYDIISAQDSVCCGLSEAVLLYKSWLYDMLI